MQVFAEQIIKNLEQSGFPSKRVSLPTEKMYEISDRKGFSLNTVLDLIKNDYSIEAEIGVDKITFSQMPQSTEDISNPFEGLGGENLMQKAQEMMAKMDPAELQKIQDQFMNMSEDEKSSLMAKGKDMGII